MVSIPVPSNPSIGSERGMASTPSNGDLALDNALIMLSALRKIGAVSGVPFLGEAALVAVRLVSLIKDVRDNNDGFRMLGLDAGRLVWTIATECDRLTNTGKAIPVSVQEHIKSLVTNLRSIEVFIEGKMVRRKLQKIIAHSSDKLEVVRYREILRTALDSFAIQASIASQEALHTISETINAQRVEVVFDRIHQTDTLNRLMQQQAEQMEQLRLVMISRYAEEDRRRDERDYYARVEREEQASQAALRAEQARQAEEDRLHWEQQKKEAETALLRKQAADKLAQIDKEQAKERLEAKKRREQAKEEREAREAIAIVERHERLEAERLRKEQEEDEREDEHRKAQEAARRRKKLERQRQEEEDELAAKKAAAAARKARTDAEESEDEARRRRRRKAQKQRRDEEERHDKSPRRRPGLGKNTEITATEIEITWTRKNGNANPKTKTKTKKSASDDEARYTCAQAEFKHEMFARDLERKLESEFEDFEDEFFDSSSSDEQEYWSDDPPRKRRTSKKSTKATARAGRARSYVDVNALRTGMQDMAMQHVHAYAGSGSPYYPPHPASPYMMPPPGPYGYNYPPDYAPSSNHAHATSVSIRNVSNSAISFGDSPAVVRNSGNVSVINMTNVGNRY